MEPLFLYLLTMPASGSCPAKGCVFVKNNYMRIVLCLFMCCALLFTCVARPASATSVAVVAGLAAIPVAVAVASAFQALGVMSASNSTDFTTTVDSCSNWLTENSSFVVNGTVGLLGLTNAGVTTSYLQKSFIQDIWEWLFATNTVQSNSTQHLTQVPYTDIDGTMIIPQGDYILYRLSWYDPAYSQTFYGTVALMLSGSTYKTSLTGSSLSCQKAFVGSTQYYYIPDYTQLYTPGCFYVGSVTSANDSKTPTRAIGKYVVQNYAAGTLPVGYVSYQNVSLGQIQSPFVKTGTETEEETIQIEIAPIYIDWTKYGVPDPNDPGGDDPDNDGKFPMWLPTGIPSPGYDDSVITQNQQQAQSGVVSGDITFEPFEPDDPGIGGGGGAGSGTDLSSVIQAIINVPTAIVSGIGNFLADFFRFNGNHDDYLVQLRDFFPFCIPFDLYDFITVLSAEPEAPVFHWEIPVPQLGQTFELEVDLSAWDDIAVLFRNLELLAFIFGLAVMTREKFLRS